MWYRSSSVYFFSFNLSLFPEGLFCSGWTEEWVVLFEDSTLAWYADKGLSRPRGRIRIGDSPDLLAVGEWTRKVPKRPRFSRNCHVGQLLAIGSRRPQDVHWFIAQSPAEVKWVFMLNTHAHTNPGRHLFFIYSEIKGAIWNTLLLRY